MTSVTFSKYSGCGNDFIVIDHRTPLFSAADALLFQRLCKRKTGIGADGVILLENGSSSSFKMRIFNSDGSEAAMCGNGLRCLVHYAHRCGLVNDRCSVETGSGIHDCSIENTLIRTGMTSPEQIRWSLKLKHYPESHYLDTGVPHLVLFTSDLETIDLNTIGSELRHHPHFAPKGTNVNVASVVGRNSIALRTYERGVEGETLACGTGAVATALTCAKIYQMSSPIAVKVRSQETLIVEFTYSEGNFKNISIIGPAQWIFSGTFLKN